MKMPIHNGDRIIKGYEKNEQTLESGNNVSNNSNVVEEKKSNKKNKKEKQLYHIS